MDESSRKLGQQKLLAALLRQPFRSLMELATEAFPSHLPNERIEIVSAVRKIVGDVLGARLADEGMQPAPLLKHRLSFCWKMLKKADKCVYWASPDLPSVLAIREQDVRDVFAKLFPKDTFPFEKVEMNLLGEICSLLDLERDGRFVKSYREFLRRTKKTKLGSPLRFFHDDRTPNPPHLRRVIWWLVRNQRTKFIDATESPPQIHTDHVVGQVRKEMIGLCGDWVQQWPPFAEEIENGFNRWLKYSCLYGETAPENEAESGELAELFLKLNELTTELVKSAPPLVDAAQQRRVRELELTVERYATENKSLEDRLTSLQQEFRLKEATRSPRDHPPASDPVGSDRSSTGPSELREMVRLIDAKYSLDVLHDLQFSDESTLTLKNFIVHFFYVLRKHGLVQYPGEEEFNLSYADSGLYRCNGFEVAADQTVRVQLIRKGWGVRQRNKLFPVRLAQAKAAGT